jgi:hypothetical protein
MIAQVSFTSFSTEQGFDFVTIYDGATTVGLVLARLSGPSLSVGA